MLQCEAKLKAFVRNVKMIDLRSTAIVQLPLFTKTCHKFHIFSARSELRDGSVRLLNTTESQTNRRTRKQRHFVSHVNVRHILPGSIKVNEKVGRGGQMQFDCV